MRICHVTPHLPPDQAANALLLFHLGTWARARGDAVVYVAPPPRAPGPSDLPGSVTRVRPRRRSRIPMGAAQLLSLADAIDIVRKTAPAVAGCDVVHLHGNGLLTEVGAFVSRWLRKPTVLTLYGTEVWHYRRRWLGQDLFTRAYRRAGHVTFYSDRLRAHMGSLGMRRRETSVVYPPVPDDFERHDFVAQAAARARLGLRNRHLLLNVKRLHPLAGQRYLIEAMGDVIRDHPDTRLVICGTGPLEDDLRQLARRHGVEGHVTFAGLVDNHTVARYCSAADLFVLPSTLEACPTVALEALASGTPVLSSDNPGGAELHELFGADVTVVPREDPAALATAIGTALEHKRRTRPATTETLARQFRPPAVAERFWEIYRRLVQPGATP